VIDATEDAAQADGIKFYEYAPRALAKAIRKALALYPEPELLDHYRQNGMRTDFSWERTVLKYEEFYQRFLRPANGWAPKSAKSVV
jgi:starch synthase